MSISFPKRLADAPPEKGKPMSKRNSPPVKKVRKQEREARKSAFAERYGPMHKLVRKDHNKYGKVAESA